MIQLKNTGEIIPPSPFYLRRLCRMFERNHYVHLRRFLETDLLTEIQTRIKLSKFYTRVHKNVSVESCMKHNVTFQLLQFLLNDPLFFRWVQHIAGCGPIGNFLGRVYQMVPGQGHYDSWHDDVFIHIDGFQNRLVGLSINLSFEVYEGGALQLRRRNTPRILREVSNVGFGDAILFRISPSFEHRLTPVTGKIPKIAYAGWFRSTPDFRDLFKRRANPSI